MKSSLIALSAAAVVAIVITGVKDRAALVEKFGIGRSNLQTDRLVQPDTPSSQPIDVQAVADRLQEAAPVLTAQAPQPPQAPAPAAQPQPAEKERPAQQPAGQQPAAQPKVDESALRYFANRGDKVRLQAEISRLQALYPNWVPPADPLAVPQSGDKQLETMWQLYAEGRYAELRKAIADRRTADTGWQPPADLLDRLDVAEARARLVNASDLKQYTTVIEIGAATPSLLTCSDIDVLWRVAEAFVHTGREARSVDAYSYILKYCTNLQERLASVQKASALLPYQAMQRLLALEQPAVSGAREFDGIRDELARRFVAEGNADPKLDVEADYVSRVARLAQTQGLASDALLLGWYQLRRENAPEAEKWFRAARAKEDSASASQGLALALVARKAPQEAEDVMYRWRSDSKDATDTYLAAAANLMALQPPADISEDVLGRMAKEVIAQKYVPAAQQFGWYARSLNQPQTAARWFETALRWKPDDEPSAYGLAITREQLNDRTGVAEVQRLWAGRSQRIATLDDASLSAPSVEAPLQTSARLPQRLARAAVPAQPADGGGATEPPGRAVRTEGSAMETVTVQQGTRKPRGCSTTTDASLLSPDAALSRGWCLMDLNRPMEAVAAFERALKGSARQTREDAAYGQSLAYLRVGLSNNAAVAATRAPQSRERAAELQVSILADRALAAYGAKRYRETLIYLDQRAQIKRETIDLMVLRGYCYLNLEMYGDAARIFNAAAATGSKDANRGLADLKRATRPETSG
ncbi:cellulose synthase [Rhizobium gallicum]|uniref:cellulose synthase n=1 Tax=Rhizobium gallicum TaxID=56730 RepID=UPI001EF77C12|nr:cellulose synthase [Rhizobium gallicum]ULJ75055.1 cellulose synthase [Rhizobium gallicum]